MQSIRIMNRPPTRKRKWNQLSRFWRREAASEGPTVLQFQVGTRSTSLHVTTVFHRYLNGGFIEVQSKLRRKKLHRMNEGTYFLEGILSNRDNVTAPIQFRREGQPQHLKRWIFLKNRYIHFHINRNQRYLTNHTKLLEFS